MNKVREGYKTTELGEIPEEWKVMKLSEIANINPRREIIDDKSMVSFIAMEDISNSGRVTNKSDKLYEEVKKGYTPFVDNDVLLAKITPCFENGKRALVDNLSNSIGFGSTEFHVLRANKYSISKFLYYVISSQSFVSKAKNNMTGSAGQKRVPTEFIKDYMLVVPKLEEQEKIASILSTVDEQIDNVDALIEKNKELKKGLMQQLLTKGIGHTKFTRTEIGEIPETWEVKKLGEIFRLSSGNFLSQKNIVHGTYPVYGGNGITGYHNEFLFSDAKVVIGRVGAKCGCVCISEPNAWVTDNALYISEKIEALNDKYMYYLLENINLNSYANQNAQPVISGQKIYSIYIGFPSIKEQEKIASILIEVDRKIEEAKNKKQKLEELKKGLIQQLLTGKIRVIK